MFTPTRLVNNTNTNIHSVLLKLGAPANLLTYFPCSRSLSGASLSQHTRVLDAPQHKQTGSAAQAATATATAASLHTTTRCNRPLPQA